jgi:hypothetical protein
MSSMNNVILVTIPDSFIKECNRFWVQGMPISYAVKAEGSQEHGLTCFGTRPWGTNVL